MWALRLIGYLSPMAATRIEVHHRFALCLHQGYFWDLLSLVFLFSIRRYLDSKEPIEVEAALFATDRVCARSDVFAREMCGKLLTLIENGKWACRS